MRLDEVLQPVGHALEQLRSLPWAAHALAGAALASGLVLWACGRRVLKPIVVVLFALLGGAIGFIMPPMTSMAGAVSVYVGLAVGVAVGAMLGVLLFKFSMAVGLGLVLGVAAPLTVVAAVSMNAPQGSGSALQPTRAASGEPNGNAETDRPPDEVTEEVIKKGIDRLKDSLKPSPAEATEPATPAHDLTVGEAMKSAGERIEAFLVAVRADASAGWDQLSTRHRLIITGSTGIGVALGIILGLVLPAWSAGAVTALLGAAIWLPSMVWLTTAIDAPGQQYLHRPARDWLIIWLSVSVLGMLIQWAGLVKRKKAKPAREARE